MRTFRHSIITACLFTLMQPAGAQSLLPYVQPMSGTAGSTTPAAEKHSEAGGTEKNANTIPAVGYPFGMTQWTPQTRLTENKCIPPYFYKDSMLNGFRGTHWLSGSCTQDYGSCTIMPVMGKLRTRVEDYALPFDHKNEKASPATYKVHLPAAQLTAEMSTTLRCGIMQFTAHRADSLYLLILPNSDEGQGFVQVDRQKGEVRVYNPVHRIYQGWGQPAGFNGWFYIKIEKAVAASGVFSGAEVFDRDSIRDQKDIGAFVGFKLNKGEQVRIRIGTSFTGFEGARANLQHEIPSTDFAAVAANAQKTWEAALGQVRVQTDNEKDKRIFYTAMYHAQQHPRLFSDVDGSYPQFSGNYQINKMPAGHYYDDFSMWDIYRAQLPLLEILQPTLVNRMVQSLVLKGRQGGWLPIFPCWNSYTAAMIGDHATAFMASAYAKGIRDYDVQEAYRLMRRNAFDTAGRTDYVNGKGRRALDTYLRYGYIPLEDSVPEAFHKKEQVSRTLEYAYDDYALASMARSLGKQDDYLALKQRALNYRNVFDTASGLVRGRHADGNWITPFLPDNREPYITEGTPRQYTFYVPQDIPGLAGLMGGRQQLEASLDSLFGKNEYWHGNEPGHQIPFLYNYTPSPWKTQQVVRRILREEYSDGPGGLSGNDDAGQMSAWYLFAALGLYPTDPVSGNYQLCAPLFDRVAIGLPGGKTFHMVTHKSSKDAAYISAVKWNGKTYAKNYIGHLDITAGGTLEFYLQKMPHKGWGGNVASQAPGLQ
ncbi:GH92 family glycosyl hydrolase [Paraflavisolibacter sp. H34]|uniref:GH92 family glycosyl hydrolase n=1 Tax=Huijunlia imazamoxiresistens TaxID=3127457 RepID=UPI003019C543